ncbi:hypothetical protein [Bradyrhizobium sp. JR3.5]
MATDAHGVSTTQNIFLDLEHNLQSDLSGATVSAVSSLEETAAIGTVVGFHAVAILYEHVGHFGRK